MQAIFVQPARKAYGSEENSTATAYYGEKSKNKNTESWSVVVFRWVLLFLLLLLLLLRVLGDRWRATCCNEGKKRVKDD